VSRLLEECGHEVLVANARKLRLIYGGKRKTDKLDAENLARLARLDPKPLYPLKHRGEDSQAHMALIRSREALVNSRTQLINHVRAVVKSFGARLPKCSSRSFHKKIAKDLPKEIVSALGPLLETIGELKERIREYERKLEEIATEHYPETELLRQVAGVGALSSLTFILTLEDPHRFSKSRSVGAYPWGWCRARISRGIVIPNSKSLRKATRCLAWDHGRQCTLHPWPFRPRLGSQASWSEDSRTWWQERQETRGSCGGPQALHTATPPLDYRRILRAAAQRLALRRSGGGLERTSNDQAAIGEERRW
jgi:transposase